MFIHQWPFNGTLANIRALSIGCLDLFWSYDTLIGFALHNHEDKCVRLVFIPSPSPTISKHMGMIRRELSQQRSASIKEFQLPYNEFHATLNRIKNALLPQPSTELIDELCAICGDDVCAART